MTRHLYLVLLCALPVLAGPDLLRGRKQVFLLPCPSEVVPEVSASSEFQDDWGKDDSARQRFKATILTVVKESISKESPGMTILELPSLCSDSASGKGLSWSSALERIKSGLPVGLDSSQVVYFSIQNIGFSVARSLHRGGTYSTGSIANGSFRMNTVGDSYKRSIKVDFQIEVFDPATGQVIFKDQEEGYHQWPLIDWITKGNWTGAAEEVGPSMAAVVQKLSNTKSTDPESVW